MAKANSLRWLWIALLTEAVLLIGVTLHTDFRVPGAALRMAICGLLAGAAQWWAVRAYLRAVFIRPRTSTAVFWIAAVGLRVLLLPAEPGDDFWRYRWEGTIQLHRVNPYLHAPDDPALAPLRDADWLRVNHRDYPAIYPPAAELIFAVLAALHAPPWGDKLLFTLADLGTVVMLSRLLARGLPPSAGPPRAAAWYAWNPLAVYAFAGGGHYDSLMLLALVAAVWTLDRACAAGSARLEADAQTFEGGTTALSWLPSLTFAWVSSLWLGLAISLKLVPAVLLPTWVFALGWRRALAVLPFAVVLLPATACIYGFPDAPIFKTLKDFAYVARLNDAFWWLVELTVWPNPEQKNGVYQQASFLVCGGLAVYFRHDWQRGLLWVLGAMLLLSPVMHPWYLVWILPFAVWRAQGDPERSLALGWVVLAASMFGYFLLWELNRTSAPWVEPIWLRLLIYVPPCIFLLVGRIFVASAPACET